MVTKAEALKHVINNPGTFMYVEVIIATSKYNRYISFKDGKFINSFGDEVNVNKYPNDGWREVKL